MHILICLALSASGNWELANETDGIKIFTRAKEGSSVREVKAMGEIDAPAERVFKVIGDYDHYTEFMPYLRESRVVAREGKATFVYGYVAPPMVSNRDYTLKIIDDSVGGDSPMFKVSWTPANDRGPPTRGGTVRLAINSGSWTLEPTPDGKTFATYYLYTDPAGSIPTFLVNKANRESLPDVVKAIRKRVKDKRYDIVGSR
jgi:hypothetical protein